MSNYTADLLAKAKPTFEWVTTTVKWIWNTAQTEPRTAYLCGVGSGLLIAGILKIVF